MTTISMDARGKRPRFFPESSTDETISMLLELMSELWTVKERLYALEQVATDAGLDLHARVERWQPSETQAEELDAARSRMITSILRSVEARHAPSLHLRRSLDAEAAAEHAEAGQATIRIA